LVQNSRFDDHIEKLLAIFLQTVVSMFADLSIEAMALREALAERRTVGATDLNQKLMALHESMLPTLTAESSKEMRERFFQLCKQLKQLTH
jgi:hypothetical protein